MPRVIHVPPAEAVQLLRASPVFAVLGEKELSILGERARRAVYDRDEVVVRVGEPGGELFLVCFGYLKATTQDGAGSTTLLSIIGPKEVFGELAVFDEATRSADVSTLESCALLILDAREVRHVLGTSNAFVTKLGGVSVDRVRRLSAKNQDIAQLSVSKRLSKALRDLAERFGEKRPDGSVLIPFRLSQIDLGAYVGASREFVNRHQREWKRQGLLRREAHFLVLPDPPRLP